MSVPVSGPVGRRGPVATVRTALPAERDAVIDLIQALIAVEARLTGDRLTERAAAEAYHAVLLRRIAAQEGRLLVAEADGRIVGLMGWIVDEDEVTVRADVRRRGFVTDLVVADGWRGQGIGRMLLAQAERLTREKGLKRLALGVVAGNDPAERLYGRAGFSPAATMLVKVV